jgi:hypothetical protein
MDFLDIRFHDDLFITPGGFRPGFRPPEPPGEHSENIL